MDLGTISCLIFSKKRCLPETIRHASTPPHSGRSFPPPAEGENQVLPAGVLVQVDRFTRLGLEERAVRGVVTVNPDGMGDTRWMNALGGVGIRRDISNSRIARHGCFPMTAFVLGEVWRFKAKQAGTTRARSTGPGTCGRSHRLNPTLEPNRPEDPGRARGPCRRYGLAAA